MCVWGGGGGGSIVLLAGVREGWTLDPSDPHPRGLNPRTLEP